MDGEFATKVALKDGRKSKVAVARKVEVLAIIDARGAGEKPFSNGIWDVQSKSLSPDWAILGNVIRQGEEVRVGEKCCGFMVVVEGVSVTHRPFEGMCAAWAIPPRNCGKMAGSAISCGRWQREFESHVTRFLLDRVCVCASRMVWGARLPSAARRRAFAICSAWRLITAGGVKRSGECVGPLAWEAPSAELREEDTLVWC